MSVTTVISFAKTAESANFPPAEFILCGGSRGKNLENEITSARLRGKQRGIARYGNSENNWFTRTRVDRNLCLPRKWVWYQNNEKWREALAQTVSFIRYLRRAQRAREQRCRIKSFLRHCASNAKTNECGAASRLSICVLRLIAHMRIISQAIIGRVDEERFTRSASVNRKPISRLRCDSATVPLLPPFTDFIWKTIVSRLCIPSDNRRAPILPPRVSGRVSETRCDNVVR